VPEHKDEYASEAYNPEGLVPQAVKLIKKLAPGMLVITDLCLCEYTSHGHCGVVAGDKILNDPTLELLAKAALVYAQAGADIIAPSDMMDGRVKAIREALDEKGFVEVSILSYSSKFASAFYGPFREAAECAPQFGDRKSYQINPANRREAIHEALLDVGEGADMLMVKPALPYLDIIREVRNASILPLAAYNVSGEYSMIKAAAANGWIDEHKVIMESLISIKRAGADIIITYFALEAARWLKAI
jgi:porphobilinogen synthase